ncbi:hypothetical protein GF373_07900 [bacterium]|nr:hypothetical protein [bacterium]
MTGAFCDEGIGKQSVYIFNTALATKKANSIIIYTYILAQFQLIDIEKKKIPALA